MLNMILKQAHRISPLLMIVACWVTGSRADCIDWGGVPTVVPIVSWGGPDFHDIAGGEVSSGYLVKKASNLPPFDDYYVYDIRNPLQPELIRESHFSMSDGVSLSIAAAEDSLCVITTGSNYGVQNLMLIADNPSAAYPTPLSGYVALAGNRMFQTAYSWWDGRAGVGWYDISNLASVVELGFHMGDIASVPAPLALSDAVVLVLGPGYEMQVVDFSSLPTAVVRGRVVLNGGVPANFRRWLGRDGDRVYYSDQTQLYALDVSDPDNLRIEFTIPGRVGSLAFKGDLGALKFQSPTNGIRVFRLKGSGSPVAMSGYFGAWSTLAVSWSGNTLYHGGLASYDMKDPSAPVLIGSGSASAASSSTSYVQGGFLVTGYGLFPTQCEYVASVGDGPARVARIVASPNPFNPRTALTIETVRSGMARLDIYDVRGHLVRNLFHGEMGVGSRSVVWDGSDDHGRAAASGSYRARLVTADGVQEAKLTLVR